MGTFHLQRRQQNDETSKIARKMLPILSSRVNYLRVPMLRLAVIYAHCLII